MRIIKAAAATGIVAIFLWSGVHNAQAASNHARPQATNAGASLTNGKIYSGWFTVNADGSGFNGLSVPNGFAAQYSNMSSDGTQVAYFSTTTSYQVISTATISGNALVNPTAISTLPPNTHASAPPMWSPDGSLVAVSVTKGTTSGVWLAKVDGSGGHFIRTSATALFYISWMPDSATIAYAERVIGSHTATNICTESTSGTARHCVRIQDRTVSHGDWLGAGGFAVSSDGKRALLVAYNFFGSSSGSADIYSANMDGSNLRRLSHFSSGEQVQAVIWAPDGTAATFLLNADSSATPSESGLYVMKRDGSAKTQISTYLYPDSLAWAH